MSISLYDVSVPALIRGLANMSALLDKAAAHAAAKKFDPLVLASARLYPDMHPLTRQVQIACDTAKGAAARLASIEAPVHPDNEVSLDDLKSRIAKTIDFLKSVPAAKFEGAEGRSVELKFPSSSWKFTGSSYVSDFVLPNFYFHESMVYALLRKNGVELGKRDFLGALQ